MEPLAAGDRRHIGPYEVRARLGAGGMGQVFLGFSLAGRAVAVKVIHPELARDETFRVRLRQEAAAAQAVSGAYTAPVIAAGPDDDPPWLATAFVPGPTLADAVAQGGPFDDASIWRLAAGLVEALEAIHSRGVVHRDLKPANVLLAVDGPRVIDFGIARALEGTVMTAAGMVIGTPSFMSPEQAEGKPPGPASDVFALGCVLAFAAAGATPFGDGTTPAVLYRVVHARPDLDGIPGPLRDLVASCLAKRPTDRPRLPQLAAAVAAGTPPDAVTSLDSFWPDPLTRLIASAQARLSAQVPGGGDLRPASRLPEQPDARARATGPTGGHRADDATRTSAAMPHRTAESFSVPEADGGSPGPSGTTRRRVLLGLAGASVAGLAAAGISTWALAGEGRPPARSTSLARGTPPRPGVMSQRPGTKLWSLDTGGQVYSCAAADGVVYIANTYLGGGAGQHNVYALDAATGAQIWRVANLGEEYSGLTVTDGVLYFGTTFHEVYALRASDGAVKWKYVTGGQVVSTPAVAGGLLFVGSTDKNVYALDAADGTVFWKYPTGGYVVSSPAVGAGPVYVGSDDGHIYALSSANGSPLWRFATGGRVRSMLAVAGFAVYAGSQDENVYALNAGTGYKLWSYATGAHVLSPVIANGIVYTGSTDEELYALHAATGAKIWSYPACGDQISWRAAVANGVVYAGSLNGDIYALNAATGQKLWSYATDGPVNSDLVVADGVLFAGCDGGTLYALRA